MFHRVRLVSARVGSLQFCKFMTVLGIAKRLRTCFNFQVLNVETDSRFGL